MKKCFVLCILVFVVLLTSCSTAEPPENKIHNRGELAYFVTDSGNYYFGVVDVKYIPATQSHESFYHIIWEYHNESFQDINGRTLNICFDDIEVYDSNDYCVEYSYYSHSGNADLKISANIHDYLPIGKKMISESNFIVNDSACEYLEINLKGSDIIWRIYINRSAQK